MAKLVEIFLDNAQSGGAKISIVIDGLVYQNMYLPAWIREEARIDGLPLLTGHLTEERPNSSSQQSD